VTEDEELENLRLEVANRLLKAAMEVDAMADLMRENERHFDEDGFDELRRLAHRIRDIATNAAMP
jgi:hypothetical protein